MKKQLLLLTMMLFSLSATAQVLIDDTNTATAPNDAAVLDLNSDTRGFLLPRLDNAPANPVDGLVYYDVTEQCFKGYAAGAWYPLGGLCVIPNTAPVASDVLITGDVNSGSTVSAAYTFTDAEGNPESGSTFVWNYGTDDGAGGVIPIGAIPGVNGSSFSIDSTYEGLYIQVCVTPSDGTDAGVEVCSPFELVGATIPPSSRINEINYDPAGTDSGEFVEIRTLAGTDISNMSVYLYNGSNGEVYNTTSLSTSSTTTTDGTYDYHVINYASNGIQNGAPDGVALGDGTTLIEFLSYEGGMTGTEGIANGIASQNIGIAQLNQDETAQRDDAGTGWFLAAGTPGAANVQVLPIPTVEFSQTSATVLENGGTYTITFNVTDAGTEDITVNISTVLNGGASAADYTTDMPATFTIPGGASSATYTFTAVDDTVEDAGESVTFTITSVSAATETPAVGANSALTVSIADDDTVVAACKTDLLFTEYYDGASNNKYVEIFNGTGAALDFTPYVIELYSGSGSGTTPSNTLDLTGTLAHNDVYVIANASATDYPDADITSGITFFNGDDILVLKKNGVIIDRIGATAGTYFAPDNGILSRAADAQPNATYTASEWTEGTNAEHTLGSYTCTPTGPVTTNYTVSIADAAPVVEGADQTFTVSLSPALVAGDVVTVDWYAMESSPVSAADFSDFTSDLGTLTFDTAGDTTRTITVSTIDDILEESDETYTVEIDNAAITTTGANSVSIATATATGVITDNDGTPTVETFTQDFSTITTINTGYTTVNNFSGPDGTDWSCRARTNMDTYAIDGNGMMVRSPAEYCDITFPNGVETITFDYRAAYTSNGTRKIDVYNGSTLLGTSGDIPLSETGTTLTPAIDVNATGPVTLRIQGGGTNRQAVFDNVTWTR